MINISQWKFLSVLILCFLSFTLTAYEVKSSGFYLSPKLIVAHSAIRNGQVKGSYKEPLLIYTDQNHEKNDNNTSDIVGGSLISIGYYYQQWRAELSYSYRYRFDLNGDVGEPDPNEYHNHRNLPGRFRLDINTQSVRLDLYYSITALQTETLKPFIGVSVESLQHNIFAKVRNAYNYTEESSNSRKVSLGFGVGTELLWTENMNFTLSLQYIDLGSISIGPQSDNAYFSTDSFDTVDLMLGVNYYF